mmetsp:Transcript_6932/g.9204  ORF Transcript_6932/g.9204 Transcript_6932/m.9204 type:complete len:149 (-) Transcript_6932:251-697(-)
MARSIVASVLGKKFSRCSKMMHITQVLTIPTLITPDVLLYNGLLNSKYKRNESNNLYEHPTLGMHRVYAIFCMNHQAYGWLLVSGSRMKKSVFCFSWRVSLPRFRASAKKQEYTSKHTTFGRLYRFSLTMVMMTQFTKNHHRSLNNVP